MKLSGGLRSVIAQMRSSTLPLKIETGRFHNVNVEERLFESYNLNLVESESHFMFVCPCYKEFRNYCINNFCNEANSQSEWWKTVFGSCTN